MVVNEAHLDANRRPTVLEPRQSDHAAVRASLKARELMVDCPGPRCGPPRTMHAPRWFAMLNEAADGDHVSVHRESHAL